jgi:hypothetical protein
MSNNVAGRMIYENAVKVFSKAFPGVKSGDIRDYCKLTQSTYRFEQPLVAGTTKYTFPVLVNQQVFSNTETRLLQQDSALIYELGIFAGLPTSLTDAAFVPKTYEAPFLFGANSVPLLALWNGSNLSITVNNDILVPNWDVMRHYNAPETQQTAALGAASPTDQWRGSFDGFTEMEPNVILIGAKNNVLSINLAAGIATVSDFSRVIIIARCITAQNSTVVS